MKKRILTSAVALASFSALTIPTIASADFTFRIPINQFDIERFNQFDIERLRDPGYCDVDRSLAQQWSDLGLPTDNGDFQNIRLFKDFNAPLYPTKCFENITIWNHSDLETTDVDFLLGAEQGNSISFELYSSPDDISGLANITSLSLLNFNEDSRDFINKPSVVLIPGDAWLCQPEQASVFNGLTQEQVCEEMPLGPWEQYAEDLSTHSSYIFDYSDWDNIIWTAGSTGNYIYFNLLEELPVEDYPINNPSNILLDGSFNFKSINGLSSIDSVDNIHINVNSLIDLSNFRFVVNNEIYLPENIHTRNGFQYIPSDAFLCDIGNDHLFTGANQSDVCEYASSIDYSHNWEEYHFAFSPSNRMLVDHSDYNPTNISIWTDRVDGFEDHGVPKVNERHIIKYGEDVAIRRIPNPSEDMFPRKVIEELVLNSVYGESFDTLSDISYVSGKMILQNLHGNSVLNLSNLEYVNMLEIYLRDDYSNPVKNINFNSLSLSDNDIIHMVIRTNVPNTVININNIYVPWDVYTQNNSFHMELEGITDLRFLSNISYETNINVRIVIDDSQESLPFFARPSYYQPSRDSQICASPENAALEFDSEALRNWLVANDIFEDVDLTYRYYDDENDVERIGYDHFEEFILPYTISKYVCKTYSGSYLEWRGR